MRPVQSLSDLLQDIKGSSSKWINERKFSGDIFHGKKAMVHFPISKSQLPTVVNYIMNQKEHHKKKKFIDEYKELLESFEINYDERFIFKSVLD